MTEITVSWCIPSHLCLFDNLLHFLDITHWEKRRRGWMQKTPLSFLRSGGIFLILIPFVFRYSLYAFPWRGQIFSSRSSYALIALSSVIITKINVAKVCSQHAPGWSERTPFSISMDSCIRLQLRILAALCSCVTFRRPTLANILQKTKGQRWA